MSSRSFVTPLIVLILVSVATVVTFSTASSSSGRPARSVLDIGRMATPAESAQPRGLLIADGMSEHTAAELSRALPGWTVDGVSGRAVGRLVPALRNYKSAHRGVPPVVVLALASSGRTARPRSYQYAVDMLPARTTVVLQSVAGDPGVVRRVADRRPRTCVAPWRERAQARRAALVRGVADCAGADRGPRSR